MRIDVRLDHRDLDAELAALHARMRRVGTEALHGLPALAGGSPDLVCRVREAQGEFHVYVEDRSRDVLAGHTVFNRVPEVDRETARYVRSPHSRYAAAYRRQGLASAVYEWALGTGLCLVSGPRQSPAAHRLWLALARSHEMAFVRVRNQRIELLPAGIDPRELEELGTRMMLLGAGWTLERFASQARCEFVAPVASSQAAAMSR